SRTLKSDFDTIGIDYSAFLKLFAKLLDAAVIFISLNGSFALLWPYPITRKKIRAPASSCI
ncbi:MAG: hypothetical protein C0610_14260, partial [Desulfobacteraceae bacterium]